jgi:aspartyl-tRNA(Asn)/glutamyl-tRNA(Gln) amidotransferase subunit B
MSTPHTSAAGQDWELVIGLEVHCQLRTRSKIFCGCATSFGEAPNVNTCPVCLGLPGALPVINDHAVALAVRASLALECTVHDESIFARKNYFYPDLPKGYQISQFDRPLATSGQVVIGRQADGSPRVIRVHRVHMEEDAGKSVHDRFPQASAIDLNRAGTPLVESCPSRISAVRPRRRPTRGACGRSSSMPMSPTPTWKKGRCVWT